MKWSIFCSSDSKVKILAIDVEIRVDKSKLEGINVIIKKYIREILLHFNLPFEKDSLEPSRKEIVRVAGETFKEITGIRLSDLNLQIWVDRFINRLLLCPDLRTLLAQECMGYMMDSIASGMNKENLPITDKILFLYLLHNDHSFYRLVSAKLKYFSDKIGACADREVKMFTEVYHPEDITSTQLKEINDYIMRRRDIKVAEKEIHRVSRKVVLFYISMIKRTKGTGVQTLYPYDIFSWWRRFYG